MLASGKNVADKVCWKKHVDPAKPSMSHVRVLEFFFCVRILAIRNCRLLTPNSRTYLRRIIVWLSFRDCVAREEKAPGNGPRLPFSPPFPFLPL